MDDLTDTEAILGAVLARWKAGVDNHEPGRIASLFSEGAIFQGLHPYSVGRQGVADYYDRQPAGLSAEYHVVESRRLSEDIVLGYLSVGFSFADRPTISVNLLVLLRRSGPDWLIEHYQVSRLD